MTEYFTPIPSSVREDVLVADKDMRGLRLAQRHDALKVPLPAVENVLRVDQLPPIGDTAPEIIQALDDYYASRVADAPTQTVEPVKVEEVREQTALAQEYEVSIDPSRSLKDQFPEIHKEALEHRTIALTLNPAMTKKFLPEIIEGISQIGNVQHFVSGMRFNSFSIQQNEDESLHFVGAAQVSYANQAAALGKNKPTSISGNIAIEDGIPRLSDITISIDNLNVLGKGLLKMYKRKVIDMIQKADILKGVKNALASAQIPVESIHLNIIGDSIRIIVENNSIIQTKSFNNTPGVQ